MGPRVARLVSTTWIAADMLVFEILLFGVAPDYCHTCTHLCASVTESTVNTGMLATEYTRPRDTMT